MVKRTTFTTMWAEREGIHALLFSELFGFVCVCVLLLLLWWGMLVLVWGKDKKEEKKKKKKTYNIPN